MKISVSIMAHPSREKYFKYLTEKLGDVPFAIDDGCGLWENCKRAWMLHDPKSEYHIVVQDDMIIGKDFIKKAEWLMNKDMIYNFYMGQRPKFSAKVERAMKKKTGYIVLKNLCHEACWGMRTDRIKEMIEHCDKFKPENDRVINDYIRSQRLPVLFTIPCFVDHRNEPSIHDFNRGKYPSGAKYFIGE